MPTPQLGYPLSSSATNRTELIRTKPHIHHPCYYSFVLTGRVENPVTNADELEALLKTVGRFVGDWVGERVVVGSMASLSLSLNLNFSLPLTPPLTPIDLRATSGSGRRRR